MAASSSDSSSGSLTGGGGRKPRQARSWSVVSASSDEQGDDGAGAGRLPFEVLVNILSRVDDRTLSSAALVNKRWNRAARSDAIWLPRFRTRFGHRFADEAFERPVRSSWARLFRRQAVREPRLEEKEAWHAFLDSCNHWASPTTVHMDEETHRAMHRRRKRGLLPTDSLLDWLGVFSLLLLLLVIVTWLFPLGFKTGRSPAGQCAHVALPFFQPSLRLAHPPNDSSSSIPPPHPRLAASAAFFLARSPDGRLLVGDTATHAVLGSVSYKSKGSNALLYRAGSDDAVSAVLQRDHPERFSSGVDGPARFSLNSTVYDASTSRCLARFREHFSLGLLITKLNYRLTIHNCSDSHADALAYSSSVVFASDGSANDVLFASSRSPPLASMDRRTNWAQWKRFRSAAIKHLPFLSVTVPSLPLPLSTSASYDSQAVLGEGRLLATVDLAALPEEINSVAVFLAAARLVQHSEEYCRWRGVLAQV